MGGIHPAVSRKSAEPFDCKGIVKHSLDKERKECGQSVIEGGTPPITCMNVKTKEIKNGQFVSE